MTTPQYTPASKRPRAPSSPRNSIGYASPDPPSKASRIIPQSLAESESGALGESGTATASSVPLICNLPPTCHHRPTPIANPTDLERHYATYHAHVCAETGCACVFPEARLLELHQTECHDPIAALNKERGMKIFQCHLPAPTCGRLFMTPKARRLHLIQAHSYPKQYFFAVTNKGIGQLLKKWGEGASMVRKEWKPREARGSQQMRDEDDDDKMDEDDDDDQVSDDDNDHVDDDEIASQEAEDEDIPDDEEDVEATPRMLPRTTGIGVHSPQSSISDTSSLPPSSNRGGRSRGGAPSHPHHHHYTQTNKNAGVDSLVDSFESLKLVPNSVRFGRGGKTSGFAPTPNANVKGRGRGARARGGPAVGPTRGRGGSSAPSAPPAPGPMAVDAHPSGGAAQAGHDVGEQQRVGGIIPVSLDAIPRGRGRGRGGRAGRSRGRGRGA